MDDLLALVVSIECAKYEPESESLPFYIPLEFSGLNENLPSWKWDSEFVLNGNYIGANGYGALAKVENKTGFEYNVIAALPSFLDQESFSQFDSKVYRNENLRQLRLSMPPDLAKSQKSTLRAVLIGYLEPPFATENSRQTEATVAEPIDFTLRNRNIYLRLTTFWVFDTRTGEVLKRYGDEGR